MEFSINYLHFHIFILNNIIFNHVSSKLSMTSIVLNLMTNFLSLSFVNSQKNLMQLGSSFFSWWFYFSFSFLFFSSVLMWLLTLLISSPSLSTIFHHYFPITLVTSEIILIYFFSFSCPLYSIENSMRINNHLPQSFLYLQCLEQCLEYQSQVVK